jgi:UDPglucose--hexose-1-phosphate uridylyltransferase
VELRKDPITQSWVIQVESESPRLEAEVCPLCPGQEALCPKTIYVRPLDQAPWQVRVIPHLRPLYRIEGDAQRRAEGIYDQMHNLGAHEIVVEHPDHRLPLSQQSDDHVALVLQAYAARSADLKKDRRFRYVTVFRNQGPLAGQDLSHPHSQITATPFIPRRVGYELRSCKRYFELKERCLLCDIVKQELTQQVRIVDSNDLFVAFCPFASRVPYETWVLPVNHHASFEENLIFHDQQFHFARFLRRVLRRLEQVASAYHLVVHTSPNVAFRPEPPGNWQSLAEDYHWHFEILPILPTKSKSYSLKEVYYNSMLPEAAARELRKLDPETDRKR